MAGRGGLDVKAACGLLLTWWNKVLTFWSELYNNIRLALAVVLSGLRRQLKIDLPVA